MEVEFQVYIMKGAKLEGEHCGKNEIDWLARQQWTASDHQDARLSLQDALGCLRDERNMQNDGNDQTGEDRVRKWQRQNDSRGQES